MSIEIQDIASTLGKFATPEVITVFGALLTAWIGWKVAAKSIGLIGSFAQKASFLGMTAAVLFVSGIGTTGLGTGDVVARISDSPSKPETKGMTDESLLKMAATCHDKDMAKLLTEYARVRDGDKNENDRILAVLVEKAQKDGDKENKALIAYMEYLKSKEVVKARKTEATSLVLTTTGVVADTSEGDKLIEEAAAKEAATAAKPNKYMFSLPTSICLMGIGLASTICGVCCWNMKKKQAARTY